MHKLFSRNSTQSCRRQYFHHLFRSNFRPEVDNDVISGAAADYVLFYVRVKFADSRSSGVRDIRGADFMSNNEHDRSLSK